MKKINIIGLKYGKLLVLYETNKKNKCGQKYYMCLCECGNKKEILKSSLMSGNTKSCGCLNVERLKKEKIHYKHGGTHTRICDIWWKMKKRCYNQNEKAYKDYGARGIKMCNEWKNDYINFYNWAINNGYSDNLTIDRINNDGNYEPNNCRWATKIEQANNRRTNIIINYKEKKYTLKQLSNILNIKYSKLHWAYVKNNLKKYEIM